MKANNILNDKAKVQIKSEEQEFLLSWRNYMLSTFGFSKCGTNNGGDRS